MLMMIDEEGLKALEIFLRQDYLRQLQPLWWFDSGRDGLIGRESILWVEMIVLDQELELYEGEMLHHFSPICSQLQLLFPGQTLHSSCSFQTCKPFNSYRIFQMQNNRSTAWNNSCTCNYNYLISQLDISIRLRGANDAEMEKEDAI